ncbi:MAG: sigma-70 family RNA polymerase sigma factor [Halanaerobiales bacterium]|nr:sigma-70 family RNA polymerase sigma factor [Halanaerobiales bacterium]
MISRYLQELNKVQLLSAEEERALWKRYKEFDDRSARQEIIKSYQPLVYKLVSKLTVTNEMMMDLIQEGIIGLIEAVENFEPHRKVRFSTYATYRIRGRVLNHLKRDSHLNVVSLESSFDENGLRLLDKLEQAGLDLEGQVEERYFKNEVQVAMERLSDQEQQIVRALLVGDEDAKDVAKKMKISVGHLYRVQRKAIKRIRGMLSRLMKDMKGA